MRRALAEAPTRGTFELTTERGTKIRVVTFSDRPFVARRWPASGAGTSWLDGHRTRIRGVTAPGGLDRIGLGGRAIIVSAEGSFSSAPTWTTSTVEQIFLIHSACAACGAKALTPASTHCWRCFIDPARSDLNGPTSSSNRLRPVIRIAAEAPGRLVADVRRWVVWRIRGY
jgi:hypothetical protein